MVPLRHRDRDAGSRLWGSLCRLRIEIEGAACILQRPARDGVRVDHRGLQVAVTKPLLDRADIHIRLQQVTGERVAERVRRDALGDARRVRGAFDRSLNVGVEHMVAPVSPGRLDQGQARGREEPLPDELTPGVRVLLLKLSRQEGPGEVLCQVLAALRGDPLEPVADARQESLRERHGAILLPLAVVHGQNPVIEVEALNPQIERLGNAKPAPVQQHHEIEGVFKMRHHTVDLRTREHHRNVAPALRAHDPLDLAELPTEDMSEEEEQRVERLILRRGGHVPPDGHIAEECQKNRVLSTPRPGPIFRS